MRIVFMGTPDFAVPSLKALLDAGYQVCAVFTQSDKPKGRKQELTAPPVKELALQYGIPVYQPKTLRDGSSDELLRSLEPDFIVVAAYGKLLPKSVLEIPKKACVNVHGSLLPKYRGAAPIQWAVINGEKYTLKGRPYTTSDDGHCTRANLFNEWVTKIPRDKARVLYGDLTGISATLINRNDPVIPHIESIYITFVYAPRK